jgi:hypothetical protein
MNIIVRPLGRGRYEALLDRRVLCASSTPFFSAARVLQQEGVPSHTEFTMRHQGSSILSLRSTVGESAHLTVRDNNHDDISIVRYTDGQAAMHFPSVGGHQGQAFQSLR